MEDVNIAGIDYVGGLCGENNGTISSSYTTGTVSGDYYIGGLCGYNYYGSISDSYATGAVSGNYSVGGLCGENHGTISSSYTTGTVSSIYGNVGGLCGNNYYGTISSSFWDVETSGIGASGDNNYGAIGKDTEEMLSQSTFTDAGWDFWGENVNGTDYIWIMDGYPILVWQYDILGGGDGSEGNPYLIKNIDDFKRILFRFNILGRWCIYPAGMQSGS